MASLSNPGANRKPVSGNRAGSPNMPRANNPADKNRGSTAPGVDKLPDSDFALPGRRYPINTIERARNALARGAQNATPEEQKKIKAAVKKRYPSIDVS